MTPPPPLTKDQKALLVVAKTLDSERKREIRLSVIGVFGLGLLGAAGYILWRKR